MVDTVKRLRIEVLDDTHIVDLTKRNLEDEKVEIESIQAKNPSKLKQIYLNESKVNSKNAKRLFELLNSFNFEILCTDNTVISNLADHLTENATWTRLRLIQLNNSGLGHEGVAKIAQNTTWTELRILRVSNNSIGNDGVIALGKNTSWKNLRVLDLSHNKIEPEGARGLATNTSWNDLTEVDLQGNKIDEESFYALSRNSAWGKLEKIHLGKGYSRVTPPRELLLALNSKISTEFNQEIKELKEEKDIETLINKKEEQFKAEFQQIIRDCKDERRAVLETMWKDRELGKLAFGGNGISEVAKSGHLLWGTALRRLSFGGWKLSPDCVEVFIIVKNLSLKNITEIDMSATALTTDAVIMMAKNSIWENLRSLNLSFTGIDDKGCLSLSQNPSWKSLQSLNLGKNKFTDEGVLYLSQNSSWKSLQLLNLEKNGITEKGVHHLSENKSWMKLEEVIFDSNPFSISTVSLFLGKRWECLKNIQFLSSPSKVEDFAILFHKHHPFSSPKIEVEAEWYLYWLELKYSLKLSELQLNEDVFEATVNEMNEKFKEELNQIIELIAANPTYIELIKELRRQKNEHQDPVELYREYRERRSIDESKIPGKLYLHWFPEATRVDWRDDEWRNNSLGIASQLLQTTFVNLEELSLDGLELTDKDVSEFKNLRKFKHLKKLSLRDNSITDEGALLIAQNAYWTNLEELDLRGNKIQKIETFATLASNKNWEKLQAIIISPPHENRNREDHDSGKGEIDYSNEEQIDGSGEEKISDSGEEEIPDPHTTEKHNVLLSIPKIKFNSSRWDHY